MESICFQGDRYLGIGMEGGLLKVVWDGGSSVLPGTMTADGAWHTVSITQSIDSVDSPQDVRTRRELRSKKHRFHQRRHALEIMRQNSTNNESQSNTTNVEISLIIKLDRIQSTPLQLYNPITTNGIFYIG